MDTDDLFDSAGPVPRDKDPRYQEAALLALKPDFAAAGILNLGSETFWHDMPIPRRWHRCRPDNRFFHGGRFVSRCACGNIAIDGSWMNEKNSRRKSSKR